MSKKIKIVYFVDGHPFVNVSPHSLLAESIF